MLLLDKPTVVTDCRCSSFVEGGLEKEKLG